MRLKTKFKKSIAANDGPANQNADFVQKGLIMQLELQLIAMNLKINTEKLKGQKQQCHLAACVSPTFKVMQDSISLVWFKKQKTQFSVW